MSLIDPVWRLVQGQSLGIDFHDPRGFGIFQVAATLWRLFGPHYHALRASVDIFALALVICGCVVAVRQLRRAAGLAMLFCITVAFVASGPSEYGSTRDFSIALSYDRLLMAGLLVLFVQSLANDLDSRRERDYFDLFAAALLLNILFLIKVSGLVVGLAIIVVGKIIRDPSWQNLVGIPLISLFLTLMVAVDLIITGTSLLPVIYEYTMAARARLGSNSALDALWFASRLRVLEVVVLLGLYVISWPGRNSSGDSLIRCFFIIAFYWVCQIVLNMSNGTGSPDLTFLAPAAAVALVTWTDTFHTSGFWHRLWRRFSPGRLHEITARDAIPLLIFAIVLVPELLASLRAVKLDHEISAGTKKFMTVSANKGVTFKILATDTFESYNSRLVFYLNRAIRVIEGFGGSHETIANLDFMNPFPALFLAPPPEGVWVWWDFSHNRDIPIGYKPGWQEIIGDACIVTEPEQSPLPPVYYSQPLIEAVKPHLQSAFTLIYHDELWNIWINRGGCVAKGDQAGPNHR